MPPSIVRPNSRLSAAEDYQSPIPAPKSPMPIQKTCYSYLGESQPMRSKSREASAEKHSPPPYRQREPSADDLNMTLTSLQLEKSRLEGEYTKIPFKLASSRPSLRDKRDFLETEITDTDYRISSVKKRLRDIKSNGFM